jgi:hypothetical protein
MGEASAPSLPQRRSLARGGVEVLREIPEQPGAMLITAYREATLGQSVGLCTIGDNVIGQNREAKRHRGRLSQTAVLSTKASNCRLSTTT